MDVCTLTLVTTLVCMAPPPPHCEIDKGKKYCDFQPTCGPGPDPFYTCTRPDGTQYTEPLINHPMFLMDVR